MKIKKIILATVLISIFTILVDRLTSGGVFNWIYRLKPLCVWKQTNIYFSMVIASTFLIQLFFVWGYAIINKGIPGEKVYQKGLLYGVIIWMVGFVPGMISTHVYMNVATTVVIYHTIWEIIVSPIKGLITALIYGE